MQFQKSRSTPMPERDAVDRGIIEILSTNGRATNLEIAERLSIAPATVSARLQRLEEDKAMRVVAVTDFAAHGYKLLMAVGVRVQGRDPLEVAQDLAKLPEVFSVHLVLGAFDIEMIVTLREFDDIHVFLLEHVAPIPGIHDLHPGIAVDIVKFEFNVAPL